MAEYATAIGFVQFPVEEREANGNKVRDFTIRTPGTAASGGGALVRCTLWPEFEDTSVDEGDFVAIDGKFESRDVKGKTYFNINVRRLKVFGQEATAEREVVGRNKL